MKNTTLLIITAKNEFELVKKVNEDKRDFFATQPYQKNNGEWIMFCYANKQENSSPTKKPSSPATEKQINALYKLNADFNAETITKKEAYLLLSKLLPKIK